MVDLVVPSPVVVVLLGLAAAGAWGTSDFGGGVLGRRAPVVAVLAVTQGAGSLIALAVTAVRNEPSLVGPDLALTLASGVLASVGIGALYGGLAIGRMGIVAPVAAVITAITPALIGMAVEGAPEPIAIAGMGLAIVAVVVVSRVADPGSDRPSGVGLAIVAGLSLGLMSFTLSRVDDAYLFAPMTAIRVVQVAVFAVVIAVGRRSFRLPRPLWPLAIGIGTVDLLGNVAFLSAARIELAPAAVVSSLYPVVTVLLAATILRERMTRSHAVGIALATVGVAMIAGGGRG
jgi:drug/metabolite transporter (DMT)-like permease